MPRYPAVWFVSLMLQALGTLWIFITIIAAIAVAISVQQAGPISVESQYADMAQFFVNTTAIAYLISFLLSMLFGLAFIGLGQLLAVLMRIESNTRLPRTTYSVEDKNLFDDLDALKKRASRPQPNRPLSEADQRALNTRRRFQSPNRG